MDLSFRFPQIRITSNHLLVAGLVAALVTYFGAGSMLFKPPEWIGISPIWLWVVLFEALLMALLMAGLLFAGHDGHLTKGEFLTVWGFLMVVLHGCAVLAWLKPLGF